MIFRETPLAGAYLIDIEKHADDRGFFARTWCRDTLAAHGLVSDIDQCSVSSNIHAGTLRGLHFQHAPHWETKLVQCTRGAIYDVIVDLRVESRTFGSFYDVELTAESRRLLYIPAGFAHGFQTLRPDSEVSYAISPGYVAEASAGIRYDDPALGIPWPLPVQKISLRDQQLPSFAETVAVLRRQSAPAILGSV